MSRVATMSQPPRAKRPRVEEEQESPGSSSGKLKLPLALSREYRNAKRVDVFGNQQVAFCRQVAL